MKAIVFMDNFQKDDLLQDKQSISISIYLVLSMRAIELSL